MAKDKTRAAGRYILGSGILILVIVPFVGFLMVNPIGLALIILGVATGIGMAITGRSMVGISNYVAFKSWCKSWWPNKVEIVGNENRKKQRADSNNEFTDGAFNIVDHDAPPPESSQKSKIETPHQAFNKSNRSSQSCFPRWLSWLCCVPSKESYDKDSDIENDDDEKPLMNSK